jgi:rhodanese-related sulfurtransferase
MRIDLRTRQEAVACPVPASVILDIPKPPLTPDQIRAMAAKLTFVTSGVPKDARIEVFCAKGIRAALAAAILFQAGFSGVVNLGGALCPQPSTVLAGTVTPAQHAAIVDFVRSHAVRDDAEFHAFVRSIGVDPHDAEPIVYQLAYALSRQPR